MKTLILVRHAKASHDPAFADAERPLTARGERDAGRMAKRLARRDLEPDLILSSPATRAIDTARLFARTLGYPVKRIVIDGRIYESDVERLFEVVGEVKKRRRHVMLFGHDPMLSQMARQLSTTIARLPTSAVAAMTFDAGSWEGLGTQSLRRLALDAPR